MADRRALCRDLRATVDALVIVMDALADEGNERADWLSCETASLMSGYVDYADNMEAELLNE